MTELPSHPRRGMSQLIGKGITSLFNGSSLKRAVYSRIFKMGTVGLV